ncbi:MAG TPA: glycosyltransferase family 39 protein [Tepidisphaeraceae bacterium]|nr:glycosyltransferase family 39 protein [Tepidisphaeraceae bacterium]
MRRPRLLLFLIILASAGVYLIGNGSVALWDRDEPRYAQTSRQMLQSGDWVVPHYLDNVRTAKPVFIYWCQAAAMNIFGDNAFAARFPSAIAMVLLLIVLSFALWGHLGPERTVWTVFIFATSGLTIAAAKMCITDAVLLLWVTIAQLCLYAMWRGDRSWPVVITMSIAIGLAGLTKGPVVLGFQATTLLILAILRWLDRGLASSTGVSPVSSDLRHGRDARATAELPLEVSPNVLEYRTPSVKQSLDWPSILRKSLVALLIIAAITLPWIILVNQRAHAFLKTAVGHDVWDRMMTPLEQHTGPPGYYLITIWITFFPWSLLLPLVIGLAIRYRAHPHTRFALAAIIGPWIMLECIRTKLPHYLLPVFPPLAFLTADALVRNLHRQHDDIRRHGFVIGVGVFSLLVALAASAPWIVVRAYQPLPYGAMVALSILGVVFAITVFTAFARRRIAAAVSAMGVGCMLFVVVAYGWYLPRADFLRLSPRIAQVLIDHGVTQPHQVIMMRYMEPSLAFHQGGTIREAGDLTLTPRWVDQLPPWIVVERGVFNQAPAEVRDQFEVVADLFGLAYADKGTWMHVLVIHRK